MALPFLAAYLCVSLVLALGSQSAAGDKSFGVPFDQCFDRNPVRQESVGAGLEDVFSLCLSTSSGLGANFENADKLFITSNNNPVTQTSGVLCAGISIKLSVADDNVTFAPTELDPVFTNQAWNLSVWDSNPTTQVINLTVTNAGSSDLHFTGIDYATLGLATDFNISIGSTHVLTFQRDQVVLDFQTLPLLESYLLGPEVNLPQNSYSGAVLIKRFIGSSDGLFAQIAYVIVSYSPGAVQGDFTFFLYETGYYLAPGSSGSGRRLLALPPVTKAPPAACARGCCKPAKPIPPVCRPGYVRYPSCLSSCSCFCK